MRLTIESTPTLTLVEGVPVRVWEGTSESGARCLVFVRLIGVREDEDSAAMDDELIALAREPSGKFTRLDKICGRMPT